MSGVDFGGDMDEMVNRYLSELNAALGRLAPPRRDQLVGEIRDHIGHMRLERPPVDLSDMEALLNRVGLPEDIAAVALEDMEEPPALPVSVAQFGPPPASSPAPRRASLPGRAWHAMRARPALAWMGAALGVMALTIAGLSVWAVSEGPPGFVVNSIVRAPADVMPHVLVVPNLVTVPNDQGLSAADAAAADAKAGLRTAFVDVVSNAPAGTVVSQSPAAGSLVPGTSTVVLTVPQASTSTS
ncbi:MAG TPA: PASTA domain-containing protein [Acidimicrobiales bacterium]|nr:PASTA domain-containing protein [Acidimicrobiales bacterium]